MGFEIYLPAVKNSNKTTSDIIITILSKEFPLSIKKIYFIAKKSYNHNVSYQAFHKAINLLIDKGIILKENKEYLLNKDWILKVQKFAEDIYLNYAEKRKYSLSLFDKLEKDGDVLNLSFNSIKELDDYFVNVMGHFVQSLKKSNKIYMFYKYNWWPILYGNKENDILEKEGNKRIYSISNSNTILNKWAMNYEKEIGINTVINTSYDKDFDFQIYGDIIIQFYIDPSIEKKIDNFFKKPKKISELNPKKLMDIFRENKKHNVIIMKNSFLSKKLKEEIVENF